MLRRSRWVYRYVRVDYVVIALHIDRGVQVHHAFIRRLFYLLLRPLTHCAEGTVELVEIELD